MYDPKNPLTPNPSARRGLEEEKAGPDVDETTDWQYQE